MTDCDTTADGATGQGTEEQRYYEALLPLFISQGNTSWFQIACSVLRVTGMAIGRWDALAESREFLGDFDRLMEFDLPTPPFDDPEATRWRLALVTYVHLVEMSAPYHLIANLLRVQAGSSYALDPFKAAMVATSQQPKSKKRKKKSAPGSNHPPLTPTDKLNAIGSLAEGRFPNISDIFKEFYFSPLRNAVAHSDYVLDGDSLKLISGSIPNETGPGNTSVVPLIRVGTIIAKTASFYRALFRLESEVRQEFAAFERSPFGGDGSEIEFLSNDRAEMIGFRVHWPSGATSEYRDDESGRLARNIRFTEGGVGFIEGALLAFCAKCGTQLKTVYEAGGDWHDLPCRSCGMTPRETGSSLAS